MRRTSARLAQLRRHLDRVKWRDGQAAEAYWTLVCARKAEPPRVNLVVTDAILKEYYSPMRIVFDTTISDVFRSLNKSLSRDKFRYVEPVTFVEERVKAICPDCEQLVGISPDGKDPATTNKRQRLDVHPDKDPELAAAGLCCPGSGKDV